MLNNNSPAASINGRRVLAHHGRSQVLEPRLKGSRHCQVYSSGDYTPFKFKYALCMVSRRTGGYDVHWFHLGELSIPDSELALKAAKLVAEISPQFLYHCMRTFLFANLIGQRNEIELLYLGAIMHDLGLTERFDGDQRYEVDGADAAREFATRLAKRQS